MTVASRASSRNAATCRGRSCFRYVDAEGRTQDVNSADVNTYLREITGTDFTAKDFRTWFGTVLAATALRGFRHVDSGAASKRNVLRAIEAVAGVLATRQRSAASRISIRRFSSAIWIDRWRRSCRERWRPRSKRVASKLRPDEAAALRILHCMRPATHRTRAA
jgi:DNA topoisomerase-1